MVSLLYDGFRRLGFRIGSIPRTGILTEVGWLLWKLELVSNYHYLKMTMCLSHYFRHTEGPKRRFFLNRELGGFWEICMMPSHNIPWVTLGLHPVWPAPSLPLSPRALQRPVQSGSLWHHGSFYSPATRKGEVERGFTGNCRDRSLVWRRRHLSAHCSGYVHDHLSIPNILEDPLFKWVNNRNSQRPSHQAIWCSSGKGSPLSERLPPLPLAPHSPLVVNLQPLAGRSFGFLGFMFWYLTMVCISFSQFINFSSALFFIEFALEKKSSAFRGILLEK